MVVATRYAKSLLGLALERGELERVYADMQLIKSVCTTNDDFVNLLESPIVKTDKKQAIIKQIFEGKISKLTLEFMNILAEKRREGYVDDVANAFVEQYRIHKKILIAVITSAVGLDDATRSKVLDIVKQKAEGEVELIEKVDKSLIGGFKLKVGDSQVDATILRKLNDLRKNFAENPFVKEY